MIPLFVPISCYMQNKRDRSPHGSTSDSVETIFHQHMAPGTEGTFGESNANAVDVESKWFFTCIIDKQK